MDAKANKTYTAEDFASDQDIRWCPGCGDYSILAQMKKVLPDIGIAPEKTVFVSGIGCSSRFPYYLNTYGIHGIHGRAPAIATGLKAARPDLSVWVITGDGDGLSIGGNHLMHAIRRNLDINIVLFNNRIYGLTKGQYSPTSLPGHITHTKHLGMVLKRAAEHKGTSFVEVYQNCNVYNDLAFGYAWDRKQRPDHVVELEHGKPLVYGADRDKGIRLNGLEPEVVSLADGIEESELLVHDERAEEPALAYVLSRMRFPEFPEPIGVFRAVERPRYEDLMQQQVEDARRDRGAGDLHSLFNTGDTWQVS